MSAEQQRLLDDRDGKVNWRQWGPYVSDRQWGTVREDYSPDGSAWDYFPHDMAPSRAYRWGEDGLAGVCDEAQRLCLALALWNGKDPLLKERLFGLTNSQGNHGEDVKEIYYYQDALPTASYLRMLYKYPHREFPYSLLVSENRRRDRGQPEFELLDTGIFDGDRYFDVVIEYAKAGPADILWEITATNRGPEPTTLHLIPQVWFRNTWSWDKETLRPTLRAASPSSISISHPKLGDFTLHADGQPELLFCDNDTNAPRLFGQYDQKGYFKDAIHDYLVRGIRAAVNPAQTGTKAGVHFQWVVPAHAAWSIRLRLTPTPGTAPFTDFAAILEQRKKEADEFYGDLQKDIPDPEQKRIQRQALAGMIWSLQYYHIDIPRWLDGDPAQPAPPSERKHARNASWRHLNNADVISMPDKWEYPWYAAWDLAFQTIPLALIDPEFAKRQIILLTREWFMHPNGQLPAYEWNFGDVNPPVHAWAAWRVFQIDRRHHGGGGHGGAGDLPFLERVFHKLLLNFTWWVNRKDAAGRNVFQGGFLGLDNIGVFDRSAPLPMGGTLDQADGTSWMAMFCLNMMRISLELALHNPVYQDVATKFFEHFLGIAAALNNLCGTGGLWDSNDEFYYDHLELPDGKIVPLGVRSMVGLVPFFAVETLEPELLARLPDFARRLKWYLNYRPELARLVSRWHEPGRGDRRLLSLLRGHRMKCLLRRMLDPGEFLSDYGVRSLSRSHLEHPYTLWVGGRPLTVRYQPGESDSGMFGGNSNWRGPIWFPMNYLLIESLQRFHHYYGDDFKVECPAGSKKMLTLEQVAEELGRRLIGLFTRDREGKRAIYAGCKKMQTDPGFRDHLLFHEYFDGDTGRGLGASHQTGWTGLVAKLIQPRKPHEVCEERMSGPSPVCVRT